MPQNEIYIADVFAEEKYAGNQLAVVRVNEAISDAAMQRIARETNFSETTFVLSDRPRDGGYDVRIFTPAAEIPFAGHPTIGTASVLRNEILRTDAAQIALNLKIGQIPVTFERQADGRDLTWMTTPYPSFGKRFDAALAPVIGLSPRDIDDRYPIEEVSLGVPFTFMPLRTLDAVRRARFRMDEFERLQHLQFNPCIFLFCRQTYGADNHINARMFAEVFGVKEDPATGSANACLAAYVLRHAYYPRDSVDLRVEQGHEIGRPSLLFLRAQRRGAEADIRVGGHVVLSARGTLC